MREGVLAALEAMPRESDISIDWAVETYEKHMLVDKGNKKRSVYCTQRRLHDFFPDFDLPLRLVDEKLVRASYDRLIETGVKPTTHHNTLAQVRTFLGWCVKQKLIFRNPAENIMPKGR